MYCTLTMAFQSLRGNRLTKKEREMKQESLKQLRRDLMLTPQNVETKIMYHIISLPTEEAHHKTHQTKGLHLMAQRVNPQISQRIMEIVQEGMTNRKYKRHSTTM